MRLMIVSHTPHYLRGDLVVGWGPTVREIDYLATLFDEVVHVAPLHTAAEPRSASPYTAPNVTLHFVEESGGTSLQSKFGILGKWPRYLKTITGEIQQADVVHIRCPANISLLAVLMLPFFRGHRARWVKYAGNWTPRDEYDPLTYRLQRWLLRHGPISAKVTVNGATPHDPKHVYSFLNPCLTDEELAEGRRVADNKRIGAPVRLLFVGGLEASKGAMRAIRVLAGVVDVGIDATMDMVGDGSGRLEAETLGRELGVDSRLVFHGWVPRERIPEHYQQAHFLLLPSDSEGWPKVLSEAMAYGVIPLASDVSSIRETLRQCGTGAALAMEDTAGFVNAIVSSVRNSDDWLRQAAKGVEAAEGFGYVRYLERIRELLGLWDPAPAPSLTAVQCDSGRNR